MFIMKIYIIIDSKYIHLKKLQKNKPKINILGSQDVQNQIKIMNFNA